TYSRQELERSSFHPTALPPKVFYREDPACLCRLGGLSSQRRRSNSAELRFLYQVGMGAARSQARRVQTRSTRRSTISASSALSYFYSLANTRKVLSSLLIGGNCNLAFSVMHSANASCSSKARRVSVGVEMLVRLASGGGSDTTLCVASRAFGGVIN